MLASRLVRDLGSVVLIRSGSMLNRWKDFPKGSWITPELVGDQFLRGLTLSLQHLPKEPFCSLLVPPFRHQDVKNIAVLIDRAPEIHLLSLDLDETLIDMPNVTQSTLPFLEPSSVLRHELQTPETDGFVRNNDASLCKHVFDIPKAESETVIEPHSVADNFRWKAMPFVAGCHALIFTNPAD
jgi:hypothetical protein